MAGLAKYAAWLSAACGSDDSAGPRPEVLDNTKHAASCSAAAAGPLLCLLVVALALRAALCPARLRNDPRYRGGEDAPELEEVACAGGASSSRRVDGYATKAGRLTSAARAKQTAKAATHWSGRGAEELQPVLPVVGWRRDPE